MLHSHDVNTLIFYFFFFFFFFYNIVFIFINLIYESERKEGLHFYVGTSLYFLSLDSDSQIPYYIGTRRRYDLTVKHVTGSG